MMIWESFRLVSLVCTHVSQSHAWRGDDFDSCSRTTRTAKSSLKLKSIMQAKIQSLEMTIMSSRTVEVVHEYPINEPRRSGFRISNGRRGFLVLICLPLP